VKPSFSLMPSPTVELRRGLPALGIDSLDLQRGCGSTPRT
jgi:hypothetical protein